MTSEALSGPVTLTTLFHHRLLLANVYGRRQLLLFSKYIQLLYDLVCAVAGFMLPLTSQTGICWRELGSVCGNLEKMMYAIMRDKAMFLNV